MCRDAGVILLYLPPYSPDLNPIQEFFAELKAFIKRQWHEYEHDPDQDFTMFLEWCIGVVGGRKHSAEGHFRHAGVDVEQRKCHGSAMHEGRGRQANVYSRKLACRLRNTHARILYGGEVCASRDHDLI